MKKLTITLVVLVLFVQAALAGGILTNANQSAQYVRMLSRNASTQIDAVYFNPAGLMKMENGFHFAFHNQTIFQTRTVVSNYPNLNNSEYEGDISAPLFPSAFAVYKTDNIALSLGFGPNGGGGSAKYDTGLPSFEKGISDLVPGLEGLGVLGYDVTGYSADLFLEGQSVFWGIQLGVSAKLNDVFSIYGGARYLPAVNTYEGHIKDISVVVGGQSQNAVSFLTGTSAALGTLADQASAAAQTFSGAATLAGMYPANGAVTDVNLIGALSALGQDHTQLNNGAAAQILAGAATQYGTNAVMLGQTSASLAETSTQVGDKKVKTKQTGTGFSPILGVNISPNEKMNIGLKYEFKTKLTLTNDTDQDDLGLFPDGAESASDIPAIFTAGVDYKFSDKFDAALSYNTYFDKDVDWGNNIYGQERTMDHNYWEIAVGVQYHISDAFTLSFGALRSNTGATEQYNSDFSYSNSSYTGAVGFEWKVTDQFTLDAGVLVTNYESVDKNFNSEVFGAYTENYDKANYVIAVGLSYSIFK